MNHRQKQSTVCSVMPATTPSHINAQFATVRFCSRKSKAMSLKNRLAENGIKNVFFGSQRKSESDTLYPHGLIVENNIIEGNLKDENEI